MNLLVKSKMKILSNLVAFSKNTNFTSTPKINVSEQLSKSMSIDIENENLEISVKN